MSRSAPGSARQPREFIAARPRRAIIVALEWLNRLVALPFLRTRIDLPETELARLRAIPAGAGIVLACNHPTFADPAIIFEVTRRWGRICNYMAAREIFDRYGGALGRLIRRAGAFSVRRGGSNSYAEAAAVRILLEGRYPIVVYPEGHTFYLNDVVLPLRPGVAAWALEAARSCPGHPIYVVPVSIKYQYTERIEGALEAAVRQLEALVVPTAEPLPTGEIWENLYARLHRLAHNILTRQEQRYHWVPPFGANIDQRVAGLCAHIVQQLEHKHHVTDPHGDLFDRARRLMALIPERATSSRENHDDGLAARFAWALSTFHAGYLTPTSSPERFAETVMKLQREITHRVPLSFRAWKVAHVRVGEPIAVERYLEASPSREDRRAAVARLLEVIHDALQSGVARALR